VVYHVQFIIVVFDQQVSTNISRTINAGDEAIYDSIRLDGVSVIFIVYAFYVRFSIDKCYYSYV
jgi:hypothetical protein